MKAGIEREIAPHVRPRGAHVHLLEEPAQLAGIGLGDARGEQAPDEPVEAGTHHVELVCFLGADLAHEYAAVLGLAHQARFFQRPERLAHRAAAHPQPAGELGLAELVARLEGAVQDEAVDLLAHRVGQRLRLQNLQGRCSGRHARSFSVVSSQARLRASSTHCQRVYARLRRTASVSRSLFVIRAPGGGVQPLMDWRRDGT